jgi:hypothetical protein
MDSNSMLQEIDMKLMNLLLDRGRRDAGVVLRGQSLHPLAFRVVHG